MEGVVLLAPSIASAEEGLGEAAFPWVDQLSKTSSMGAIWGT